jgi:putative PEP-CTERM system TPR-repeat lipoprotein
MVGTDTEATALAGMASIRAGDPEAAIELFRRELEGDPNNDDVRMQLVVSLMAAGRNDEALAQLGMMSELDDAGQLRADLVETAVHLQARDFELARDKARAAAEARPGDPQVRNSLGALFMSAGQADDATAWFEDTLKIDAGNAAAHFNLGRMAAAAGRAEAAEGHFNAVLESQPDNAATHTALAQLAWSTGRRAEAIRRLEELGKAQPDALQPRLLLARYLQAEGESARALEVARETATRHPESPDALNTFGRMLFDAGQHAEALRTYEQAISLSPGNPQLLFNRARADLALGQPDRAREALRNALALDPDFAAARFALVDLDRRSGRLDAAESGLAALKQNQGADDPGVALLEGELLLARRQPADAVAAFEKARAGGIGSRAVVGLFQAKLQSGAPEPERVLEDALEANPDDTPVRVLVADHYLRNQRYAQAIGHYEILVRRQPDNAALLNNLAWLYNEAGDPRALETAERAHAAAPEAPHVMDTLGWILHQRGQTERAFELISRAVQINPDIPEIRYHHAVLLAETGDAAAAAEEARALLADETAVGFQDQAQALLNRLGL